MLNAVLTVLLVAAGGYFTLRSRFVQLTSPRRILKCFQNDGGGATPFEALSAALAGSVGTGNIAGVASAIAIGGPGAVMWMWLSAFFGMALKYAEVTLAMRYRVRDENGDPTGGAMWCVRGGLGKKWRFLAPLFCAGGMLAALSTGCMVQSNTIACAVSDAAGDALLAPVVTGVIAAAAVGLVVFRGQRGVIRAASLLVPFMSVLYIAASLVVIIMNIKAVPGAFALIFRTAFGWRQAAGGAAGFALTKVVGVGVSRGVFTHEAGMGSSPLAHTASGSDAHSQGLLGVVEVFIDTMVLCTLTALMLLCSGIPIPYGDASADGMALAGAALSMGLSGFARPFLAAAAALFAYSSIITWSMYGAKCAEYLKAGAGRLFLILFTVCCAAGAIMKVEWVWRFGEAANALMAIPNLIMLMLLRSRAVVNRKAVV